MLKKAISLVLLLLIVFAALPVMAQAGPGGVTMSVEVGYGGKYVVGKVAPVKVTVKNDGEEIAGALELRTGTGFSLVVRREVVLPKGTEKEFTLFVMASGIYKAADFEVHLVRGGATLASAVPPVVSGVDPDKPLCGILSDDPASVGYFKKILFDQSSTRDWIDLAPTTLYDNAQLLESFSLIVVDGVDPSALTGKQCDALRQWVYGGGTLILGTGPGGEPGAQWRELTGGLSFGATINATGLGGLSSLAQGRAITAALPALDLLSDGWTTNAQTDAGKPLVVSRGFGQGSVYVAAFRLGEGVMGDWDGAGLMWQSMLNGGAYAASQYAKGMYGGYYGPAGEGMRLMLQQGMAGGGVTLLLFLVILAVFVALAGFVGYIVLKALGRQRLMWVLVPALSVLFSCVLLLLGSNSLGRKPHMAALTATDISGSISRSTHTLGFVSPAMDSYRIAVQDAWMLYPVVQNDYNYYSGMPGTNAKQDISAVTHAGTGDIEFLGVNLNGTRMASFKTFSEQTPLQYAFTYDGKAVNCVLKNVSEWPIEAAATIIGGSCEIVGDLAPGEERKFTMQLDQTPPDQGFWSAVDRLYPYSYGGGIRLPDKKALQQSVRNSFLREQAGWLMAAMSGGSGAIGQALCIGWVDRPFDYTVTVNGGAVTPDPQELLMAVAPIGKGGDGLELRKAYATLGSTQAAVAGVTMKGQVLMVQPGNTAVVEFRLTDIATLKIGDLFFEPGTPQGMSVGSWSIYDWQTAEWIFAVPKQHFTGDDIAKYINPDGVVRMSMKVGPNDYFEGSPYVWVQGVAK